MFRSSHRRCSVKISVFKNFASFTGKHPCWSHFLIKIPWQNFKNTYFEEHLRTTSSICLTFTRIIMVLLYLYSIQKQPSANSNFIEIEKSGTGVFLWIFWKFLKTFFLTDHRRWLLLSVIRYKNAIRQLHAMGWLFDGKDSQWGKRFLPVTEAYLEPRRISEK